MGRPSDFSQEIVDRICERLADGESLRAICASEDMPSRSMVFRWLAAHEAFRDQYARAREAQADAIFDDLLDIADDGRNDWMERCVEGEVVGWKENGESARRSALRVDARKWMLGKMQPKKYGEKLAVDHSGAVAVDTRPDFSGLSKDKRDVLKLLLMEAEQGRDRSSDGGEKPAS